MAKTKKAFVCQSCGTSYPQWAGQCRSCSAWNTLVEEVIERAPVDQAWVSPGQSRVLTLDQVDRSAERRVPTGDLELDRVLGGGWVPGSLSLLGGEPGIGKSTLMLQVALHAGAKALYASGEESAEQIRMRAERIGFNGPGCHVLAEVSTSKILQAAEQLKPDLLVVDSIQTAYNPQLDSAAGSVGQIRESAAEFLRYAKARHVPVALIGHITKEGTLAGPKVLEHMVDVVLQFEGDKHHLVRTLRALKNRFGSTQELGLYEMAEKGLQPVANPSAWLLGQRGEGLSGSAIGITAEGLRPLLVEVQALVSTAVYGTPQRSCTGFDTRRLNMLLAVLEKRCGFHLASKDVFLNVTGGLRVDDPALDLAVCAAILSSQEDRPIPPGVAFAGEVGLGGELRPIARMDARVLEAGQLGFDYVWGAKTPGMPKRPHGVHFVALDRISQVVDNLF